MGKYNIIKSLFLISLLLGRTYLVTPITSAADPVQNGVWDSNSDQGNFTGNSGITAVSSNTTSSSDVKSGVKTFDPFLDNHLKAPPEGIRVGKFGQTIKEVENELRLLGAKNHSYAFGKYSKMVLSYYMVTLSFDVNKRLGMVEIKPKPPLNSIEPKAKDFFIKLFTEGADMTQIGMVMGNNRLELRFLSPSQ